MLREYMQSSLLKILSNKQIGMDASEDRILFENIKKHADLFNNIKNTSFIEIDKEDIFYLFIPFIEGIYKNSTESLLVFIETILKIEVLNDDISHKRDTEIYKKKRCFSLLTFEDIKHLGFELAAPQPHSFNILKTVEDIKNLIINREDKIYMTNKINAFNTNFMDWDEKDSLRDLLEICFYHALINYRTINNIKNIKENKDIKEEIVKPTIFNLLKCGHLNNVRNNLLKRRINPTMNMDEYVASLMNKVESREKNKIEKINKENVKDSDIRRKDEDADLFRNFRGNTKNVS